MFGSFNAKYLFLNTRKSNWAAFYLDSNTLFQTSDLDSKSHADGEDAYSVKQHLSMRADGLQKQTVPKKAGSVVLGSREDQETQWF